MRQLIREGIILASGAIALVYLVSPSILPDFVPFIGWLDEGIATTILLNVTAYYGLDVTHILGIGDRDNATSRLSKEKPTQKRKVTRVLKVPKDEADRIRGALQQGQDVDLSSYEDVTHSRPHKA